MPRSVSKQVRDLIDGVYSEKSAKDDLKAARELAELPQHELGRLIQTLEEEMHEASADLRFEYAARLRDEIHDLKRELREVV